MNKTERILIAATAFYLVIMCLMGFSQNEMAKKRLDKAEIRLQHIEGLLSLALSESRPPALTNRIDGLRNDTNAPRKRADAEIK